MITWLSAFFDLPADVHDEAVRFHRDLTGYGLSPARGERSEFATLVPAEGGDYLRVQRLADGPARIHLDLRSPEPQADVARAVDLGATVVAVGDGHTVLRSPGGLVWCVVTEPAGVVPPAIAWPGGHRSRLAQVCLDAPAGSFEAEVAFWSALTEWPVEGFPEVTDGSEVVALRARAPGPLRMIVQRLGADDGGDSVRAHVEWWTDDVAAEVARHLDAGARHVADHAYWTVLRDVAGLPYCVIGRDPATGRRIG